MSAGSPVVLRTTSGHGLIFWCPGCNEPHAIEYGADRWTWDGNMEAPTLSPSILVRSGHYAGPNGGCWCQWDEEHPNDPTKFKCGVCHSDVRAGRIEFLNDCTHALAGQTVPLPAWPDDGGVP